MSGAQDLFAIDAEARRLQRHNDAAKVRAAGCVCYILEDGDGAFAGTFRGADTSEGFERIVVDHDPRCPLALADLILEGGA